MAYIIAEPCLGALHTACVEVCPTDAIHGPAEVEELRSVRDSGGAEALKEKYGDAVQMYIDPEECISCGACQMECPEDAIFEEEELPSQWASYLQKAIDFYAKR